MTIDIQISVTRCKGFIPRLIQFAQGGDPFVHAYAEVRVFPSPGQKEPRYRRFIANAEPEGLITRDEGYWGLDNPTSDLQVDEESASKMLAYIDAELKARARYDFDDDGVLGLDMVAQRYVPWLPKAPFRWLEKHFSDGKTLMCSQFVVDVLRAGGLDPWPGRESGSIAPRDVHEWLKRNGWA